MARPKKPKYEYVERLGLYRKRVKDINGKYVAVYGKNPDELTDKIADFHEAQKNGAEIKDNLLFNDYAQRWMDLHGANGSQDAAPISRQSSPPDGLRCDRSAH